MINEFSSRLISWLIALLAFAMLIGVLVTAAPADHLPSACGPYKEIKARLAEKYLEAITVEGTIDEQRVMQIFSSESGSWSFVVVRRNGSACLVSSGENFQSRLFVPPETGEDS